MKIGDRFKEAMNNHEYVIVQGGFRKEIVLVALTGTRLYDWDRVSVASLDNITESEFTQLMSCSNPDAYVNLDGSPLFPEETYEIGDHFVMTDTGIEEWLPTPGEQFMLVQVNGVKALVSMSSGNYWMTGKEMGWRITKEDLKSISGRATFEKVSK